MNIVFTGDIAFSMHFEHGHRNKGVISDDIAQFLSLADHVVGNIESPLTNSDLKSDRKLNHRSDEEAGSYLKKKNIGIWSIANNHIMDCGVSGMSDTLRCAQDNGCSVVGGGIDLQSCIRPLIIEKDCKVAVFSVASPWKHVMAQDDTPGALTWNQMELLSKAIKEIRPSVDWIVVAAHGGDEYCSMPLPYVRKVYHRILEIGADVVVGHHPHVVQNYESVGNKIIFYSLGNFVFDTENQRSFRHTDTGVLLKLIFTKTEIDFEKLPVLIDRESNTVVRGALPDIFCDICADEYALLWPLAAKQYYPVNEKRLYSGKKNGKKFALYRLVHRVYMLRYKKNRELTTGCLIAGFGKWKKSQLKTVLQYLLN